MDVYRNLREEDLDNQAIFKNINNNSKKVLLQSATVINFNKGEHIFRDKDEVNNIYIVISGKVSLYKISESAQKRVVFILCEGDIINAVILDDLKASINCEAFEKSEILSINKNDFTNLMEMDFELTKVVINSLAIKVRRLYRQTKNSVPIKVEKKVAAKLWKLAKDYGVNTEEGVLIDINISITYLSDMFGMPRETISRALKVLQKEGLLVIKGKKFIVKDKDRLVKYFKGV